jgi:hypothetical protein
MKISAKKMKRTVSVITAAALAFMLAMPVFPPEAEAKTVSSEKAQNIFIYGEDADGKDVLMGTWTLDDLKKIEHGQEDGRDYYYSSTDNYPTTQYCEARGFTIPELVSYVAENSTVAGASGFKFKSGDTIYLMATDSYGNYTRNWTYDALYEQTRFYFSGLYDADTGWNSSWEVAGEDNSKYGIDLDTYNSQYRDSDPNYADKRSVFASGVEMPVILATESYSGRTTSEALNASTEPGLASVIEANGGEVTGSLKDSLTDETALRLCIPMTEADLMSAHRTSFDNFKWIYNIKFKTSSPSFRSEGTVAAPAATFSLSGDKLSINISCATPGARIYYSFDGAPQIPYTGTITYDTGGADLTSSPVTIYMTAVKDGFDDTGVVTAKYPQSGVTFKTQYSGTTGSDVVFEAEDGVSSSEWNGYVSGILGITVKTPDSSSYKALSSSLYSIDNDKMTITFDKSIFTDVGSYNFTISSKGYANKRLSISMKKGAPAVSDVRGSIGTDIVIPFDDDQYQNSLYLYITTENGERKLISSAYADRSVPGQVTLKKEWFDQESCPVKEPGTYSIELVNNSYSPSSQTITLDLMDQGAFVDVAPDAWYASAVDFTRENGLFAGVDENHFAPDTAMTRAMFAAVLYRYAGSPDVSGENRFADVNDGEWYTKPVIWADQNGYITGYGDGTFGTDDPVTREQIAAVLYRYSRAAGNDVSFSADLSGFTDRDQAGAYALDALCWAVDKKIVNGVSSTELDPRGAAGRAQVAQMFMNYSGVYK